MLRLLHIQDVKTQWWTLLSGMLCWLSPLPRGTFKTREKQHHIQTHISTLEHEVKPDTQLQEQIADISDPLTHLALRRTVRGRSGTASTPARTAKSMELIQELHNLKDELKELQQQQKLNRIELDSIHEKLKEIAGHSDTAAIRKARLDRSNCLPCDRPVGKQIPRPRFDTRPSTPALPSHKSVRSFTGNALEQHYKSSSRVSEVTEGRILIVTKMPLEIRPNTSVSQRRSSPQHVKHHHHHQVENSVIQSEDKGHLDIRANRNTQTKHPPFSTKYAMCKTKSKSKSSTSRKTPPTGCLMYPHTPRKLPEDWLS